MNRPGYKLDRLGLAFRIFAPPHVAKSTLAQQFHQTDSLNGLGACRLGEVPTWFGKRPESGHGLVLSDDKRCAYWRKNDLSKCRSQVPPCPMKGDFLYTNVVCGISATADAGLPGH